jgi:isopentenyl-diphosphate Delta-isomerase
MPATNLPRTNETIILVDPEDHQMGEIEKILGHEYAMLHRAFSVLIFRKRNGKLQLLLQQRSKKKYHGGGLWTNTCCGHPHPGEGIVMAAEKRLVDEMGIKASLVELGKFHYVASLDNGLTENEIDHVFIGTYDTDEIPINPDEVANYQWMDVDIVKQELVDNSKKYTPWFKQALELALDQKIKARDLL